MKKIFKRSAAILLVVITLFSTIFAVPVSAATVSITFDYCYDTAGNIITFKQTVTDDGYTVGTTGEELCRIYADGKDAYCIEPGHSLYAGDTLDDASSTAWKSLTEGQRTAVNLAILYGKGGNSKNLGGTDGQQWVATQIVVWEIVTGCRKTTGSFDCTNTKFINAICKDSSNPGVRTIYNKISNALAAHTTVPSFTKVTKNSAPTHEMKCSNGKYTLTLTDSNKILSKFNFKSTGNVAVSQSGNTLTLSTTKPFDADVAISSAKSVPSAGNSAIVAFGDSSLQDVVKGVGKPDPLYAYFKVTAKPGNLKILKTSEDGVVANVEFKITGSNYSKTVKTDSNGVFNLPDLMPGTYNVTEITDDKYVPQETHTVTVVAGKTATVTFNNVLKRGELTVEKVADDNIVEGIKFHLYGTSKDGVKVDEYAVTDKDGIARFKDVLVSGTAPYTVEEINVDENKYIAPDKQTVTIKWKENSELTFKNKLKKATILTVYKSGEVFYGVDTASTDNGEKTYQPVYRNLSLAGAKYEIRAAADIVTEDGKKYYSKGDLIETVTTNSSGVAKSSKLYLGKYTIKEIKAPDGMVLNSTPRTVELKTENQTVSLSETRVNFINERQKVKVSLEKVLEKSDAFGIGNGDEIKSIRFGLYADEKITASNGSSIPQNGLIEVVSVSDGGKVTVKTDLPFGKYYLKEIATDKHYILGTEKFSFEFDYQGQNKKLVEIDLNNNKPYENKLIYGSVSGVKVDEYNNKLGGALIGLFKSDEKTFTVDTAILKTTSNADGSFKFDKVPFGKYVVREIKQPTGFVINDTTYPVEISKNAQVIEIEIVNTHIKGDITLTKVDADYPENKLTGATFELYIDTNADGKLDKTDKLIGNLDEENEGIYEKKNLDYGHYLVRERKAPTGFELDEGIYSVFIEEDGKTYTVENKAGVGFINNAMKGSLKILKRSEDNKVDGFSFRVTGVNGYDETFVTDENGVINITGLRIGEYKVSEVENTVSNSYILPDDKTLEIKYEQTTEVEMYNKLKKVPKTGDDSNLPLVITVASVSLAGVIAAMYILFRKKKGNGK